MISALSGNYKRELFKPIAKIIPKCENIIQLKAFCGICKEEEADFTLRTINNEEEIYIGGADVYKPVCRTCYKNPDINSSEKIEIMENTAGKGKILKV